MSEQNNPAAEPTHFMVRSTSWPGYWGRGKTVHDAAQAARYMNPGDKVHLIKVDAKAYCDAVGDLQYTARERLGVGVLKRDRKGTWRVDNVDPTKV